VRFEKKLLSLVTFFAAAKKVTPAPGRGAQIDRHEYKFSEKQTQVAKITNAAFFAWNENKEAPTHFDRQRSNPRPGNGQASKQTDRHKHNLTAQPQSALASNSNPRLKSPTKGAAAAPPLAKVLRTCHATPPPDRTATSNLYSRSENGAYKGTTLCGPHPVRSNLPSAIATTCASTRAVCSGKPATAMRAPPCPSCVACWQQARTQPAVKASQTSTPRAEIYN